MKLFDNPASPFCRKVQILALETGQMDSIEIVASGGSPVNSENMPTDQNPLGKIPALQLDDGSALYDSRVICRYLDDQAAETLYPTDRLYDVLRREALADGIMDAAVAMVYEFRARPEGGRSPSMVEALWIKVSRALDNLEADVAIATFDMGQIALACALGYLDFRHDDRGWRDNRPKLAAWFKDISARSSLSATVPHA